jgi:NADPH-dependent 2,4-dienoyl-CoA reductase/sulfur reductase-like enzyme
VSTLRTIDDAHALREVLRPGARIVIAGAGFVGQEVAAAARAAGAEVTIVEAAPTPLHALLGPAIGGWFAWLHLAHGVDMVLGSRIAGARSRAGRVIAVVLGDGRTIACDHVVVGVGVDPDVAWAGLHPGGVRASADGRTGIPGVFAAGDAAATYDPALGRHVRGGQWEAAGRQGAAAARSMLGFAAPAPGPASFWSDLYGTRVQFLGRASLADDVAIDGDPAARDFTVTFTRSGVPVAVLLAGRPQRLPLARALLSNPDHHLEDPTCPTPSSSTRAPAPVTATALTSPPRSSAWTTWRPSSAPAPTT